MGYEVAGVVALNIHRDMRLSDQGHGIFGVSELSLNSAGMLTVRQYRRFGRMANVMESMAR